MRLFAIALLAFPAVLSATTCDTGWARTYRSELRESLRHQRAALGSQIRDTLRQAHYARLEAVRERHELRRNMERERRQTLRDLRREQRELRRDRVY